MSVCNNNEYNAFIQPHLKWGVDKYPTNLLLYPMILNNNLHSVVNKTNKYIWRGHA